MAILWQYSTGEDYYEVRSAGSSVRLYRNGVHHSQWNPKRPLAGSVWDLLALPALHRTTEGIETACILGFGAGAAAGVLGVAAGIKQIVGVELDPLHLSVADGFFGCSAGVELVTGDAVEWVRTHSKEGSYDLIIDDLYGELDGEPVRYAPLDDVWFGEMVELLRPGGMLVLNLIEPDKVPHLPPMRNAELGARFPYRKVFWLEGYENRVVAFSERPLKAENFRARLRNLCRAYPACYGVGRRYLMEDF
ncbi:MAG: Polyamine aminopropyltransferase [Opitutia bacterium UBA7350]|nr:MAG: Polyamine aminopropyltransferase [Opitutae bacterium UBA7350]